MWTLIFKKEIFSYKKDVDFTSECLFFMCNSIFFVVDYALPEVCAVLFWLSLMPLDLLRISCCPKRFYVLSHQGQKYRERLEHSRSLVNSAKMDQIILLETQKVFRKICGIRIFFGKFEKKVIP